MKFVFVFLLFSPLFAQSELVLKLSSEDQTKCNHSKYVTFHLRAEGVAVNGERPVLKLKTACRGGDFHFPMNELHAQIPRTGQFVLSSTPIRSVASLDHGLDQWPADWVLEKLEWDKESVVLAPALQKKIRINW